MSDYKLQSAQAALQFVAAGQIIGLGDGTSILYMADLIAADKKLATSVVVTSSSERTMNKLKELGLIIKLPAQLNKIDVYFDGCDQFDEELNALKSGAGIHAIEKVLASMSTEFILIGDSSKFSKNLTIQYPVVIEALPIAVNWIIAKLKNTFPEVVYKLRLEKGTESVAINERKNYLLDIFFNEMPNDLAFLDALIKMLPGVVDHSLFYRLATKAVIAGTEGIEVKYRPL